MGGDMAVFGQSHKGRQQVHGGAPAAVGGCDPLYSLCMRSSHACHSEITFVQGGDYAENAIRAQCFMRYRNAKERSMDLDLIQATQHLARGHTMRILDNPGGSVLVLRGSVWLTREADSVDYVLDAGESFMLDERTGVVATALEDSAIAVLSLPSVAAASGGGGIDHGSVDAYRRHAEALRSRYLARSLRNLPRLVASALRALRDWHRPMTSAESLAALKYPYF